MYISTANEAKQPGPRSGPAPILALLLCRAIHPSTFEYSSNTVLIGRLGCFCVKNTDLRKVGSVRSNDVRKWFLILEHHIQRTALKSTSNDGDSSRATTCLPIYNYHAHLRRAKIESNEHEQSNHHLKALHSAVAFCRHRTASRRRNTMDVVSLFEIDVSSHNLPLVLFHILIPQDRCFVV